MPSNTRLYPQTRSDPRFIHPGARSEPDIAT